MAMTPTKAAWDDEDANVVVYGTHNPEFARALYVSYLTECGFADGDEEWSERADDITFYDEEMTKLWTLPKDGDDDAFDQFTEPGDGRVPYMWGSF